MEKFCYLGDMIRCYGGASEAVCARIGNVGKQGEDLSELC